MPNLPNTATVAEPPAVVMLTTTTTPYVYHVPTIVGLPTGATYWFRYKVSYLDESLRRRQLRNHLGILYFRNNESQSKLCYPLRHFQVLWSETHGGVCFLNVLLKDLIVYQRQVLDQSP